MPLSIIIGLSRGVYIKETTFTRETTTPTFVAEMSPVFFLALSFSSVLCRPADEVAFSEGDGRSKYGRPSEESGKLVEEWSQHSGVNPEELGEYMEGDILHVVNSKNGLLNESARWEGGVVPYVIKGPYNQKDLSVIFGAMDQYHNKTCIR